jgi:hypothetical protein
MMRWRRVGDLLAGTFSGLIAGYLLGLTIGFTLFDPELDVWALLGALLAVMGAVIGLLPLPRRYATVTLAAITGYYAGMLFDLVAFVQSNDRGLLAALQHPTGVIVILCGTLLGAIIGWRIRHSAGAKAALAGLALGGFLTPLIVLPNLSMTSEFGLASIVLIGGLVGGLLTYGLFRRLMRSAL